jgi:ferric-dicitrate binding protein FerR (iron transport regulator)
MTDDNDRFDKNLKRMLSSTLNQPSPGFQDRLVQDVLAEVARQRNREQASTRRQFAGVSFLQLLRRPLTFAAAGAAVVALVLAIWMRPGPASRAIGRVSCIYGLVAVQDNGSSRTVSEPIGLKSGQRVMTRSGSKAQILLPDQSRLTSAPRTTVQIAQTRQGARILLEHGTLGIEAAKQPRGKSMTIEASHAHVKVLGTKLDVRLVERPSGTRQTRVRVLSGSVEMESGGQKLLVPAGTEGVADEGQPPVRYSSVFEVNELIRLIDETHTLVRQSGRAYALPAIIDLTASTVWSIIPVQILSPTAPNGFSLRLKYPAFGALAYSLDGVEIPSAGSGEVLRLDISKAASALASGYFIVKVPGVGGLLRTIGGDRYECALSASDTDLPSLIQLHLPDSARIEDAAPALAGTTTERNKLIITVAACARLPQVHY